MYCKQHTTFCLCTRHRYLTGVPSPPSAPPRCFFPSSHTTDRPLGLIFFPPDKFRHCSHLLEPPQSHSAALLSKELCCTTAPCLFGASHKPRKSQHITFRYRSSIPPPNTRPPVNNKLFLRVPPKLSFMKSNIKQHKHT